MTEMSLTRHAVARIGQRGISVRGLKLAVLIGTEVEGGYLVRSKDCQAVERYLKHLIDQVRRLKGKRLVTEGDHVVTAYHARRAKERRLLRGADERSMRQG